MHNEREKIRALLFVEAQTTFYILRLFLQKVRVFILRQGLGVAQSNLELEIFLPQPPRCSDYKCVMPYVASAWLFNQNPAPF